MRSPSPTCKIWRILSKIMYQWCMRCRSIGSFVTSVVRYTANGAGNIIEFAVNGDNIVDVIVSSIDVLVSTHRIHNIYVDVYVYVDGGCRPSLGDVINLLHTVTDWFVRRNRDVPGLWFVANIRLVDSESGLTPALVSIDYSEYSQLSLSFTVEDRCDDECELGTEMAVSMDVYSSDKMNIVVRRISDSARRIKVEAKIHAYLGTDEIRRFVPSLVDSARTIIDETYSIATRATGIAPVDHIEIEVPGIRSRDRSLPDDLFSIVESWIDGLRKTRTMLDLSAQNIRVAYTFYLLVVLLFGLLTGNLLPGWCKVSLYYSKLVGGYVGYICTTSEKIYVSNRQIKLILNSSVYTDFWVKPDKPSRQAYKFMMRLFDSVEQVSKMVMDIRIDREERGNRYLLEVLSQVFGERTETKRFERIVVDPLGNPRQTLVALLREVVNVVSELSPIYVLGYLGN